MQQMIPFLNCLWNDALHFSPVHPQIIIDELKKAGMAGMAEMPASMEYFEIDSTELLPENSLIYLYRADLPVKMSEENFAEYNDVNLSKIENILPEMTKEYFITCIKSNQNPLMFHGVPHILYKGILNVTKFTRIAIDTN